MNTHRPSPSSPAWRMPMVRSGERRHPLPRCHGRWSRAAGVVAQLGGGVGDGVGDEVTVALVGVIGLDTVAIRLGRAVADHARTALRDRLSHETRPSAVTPVDADTFLVAVPSSRWSAELGRRILRTVREPIAVAGRFLGVSAAIGVAAGPASDSVALIAHAEANLRAARRSGPGSVSWRTSDGDAPSPADARLASRLRDALRTGEVGAHFQPVVELATGTIAHVEALVRWTSPELGAVAAPVVVAAAERSGLIHALGRHVTGLALDVVAAARRHDHPGAVAAVNVSPTELEHDDYVGGVLDALRRRALPGGALRLEITEGVPIGRRDVVRDHLGQLRAHGVVAVLDDFGTGHANLETVRDLPVAGIKLDRTFVRGLPGSGVDERLVRYALDLAGELGIDVVAEGVESPAHHDALVRLGCRFAQGYHYAVPRPAPAAFEPVRTPSTRP